MKLSVAAGAALVIGGIALGGVMSSAAQDATEEPATPKSEEVRAAFGRGPKGPGGPHMAFRGPAGPMIRSESVFKNEDGEIITNRVDHGTIASVAGDEITINAEDSSVVHVTVNDDTAFRRDGEEAELGDLKTGDQVMTHRSKTGDAGYVTKHVGAISAEKYAEMEARREACKEDPESEECGRPDRPGPGMFRERIRERRAGDDATAEPTEDVVFFEEFAA